MPILCWLKNCQHDFNWKFHDNQWAKLRRDGCLWDNKRDWGAPWHVAGNFEVIRFPWCCRDLNIIKILQNVMTMELV